MEADGREENGLQKFYEYWSGRAETERKLRGPTSIKDYGRVDRSVI
jgi:hypothetical protein